MQSPNRAYVPELDQLRGIAALLVFFFHSVHTARGYAGLEEWPRGNPLTDLIYEGHAGVALFMVLSGFVLARGAIGVPIQYGQFIRNRALRIFPLMIFVLVFAVYGNTDVTLSAILAPFLLLSNTNPRLFNDVTDISAAVWTIAVEFQFYLIAPFVFAFVSQRGLRYLAGLIAIAWIAKCIVLAPHLGRDSELHMISYFTIVGRLNQFLAGVGLAYLWPQIEQRLRNSATLRSMTMAFAIVAFVGLAYFDNRRGGGGGGGVGAWPAAMAIYPEVQAAIFAALIASFVVIGPLGKGRVSALVVRVGVISYSIYILHWPIQRLFWRIFSELGLIPAAPGLATLLLMSGFILLPILLAIAWLSYNVIELPFLNMRRRYVSAPSRPG